MRVFITYIILLLSTAFAVAQDGVVNGTVASEGEAVPFANVGLVGTNYGAATDDNGVFTIKNVPAGNYELVVALIGYNQYKQKIEVKAGQEVKLQVVLEESSLELNQVVVTGTMKEVFISNSPVKVEVISSKYLENTVSPTNLVESISLVNGVQEVVACGVCYTNSISINGLPGPYTAVLVDGSPIYGNLASVYGLNGIPASVIDRFEVIKGPSSTLYGSEAVAGVINIITKSPETQPVLAFDLKATTHLESFGNIAVAPKIGNWYGIAGIDYAYVNKFEDQNGDGFGDMINMDRVSAFSKWSLKRKEHRKFTISGKYYYEDRRNGVEAYMKDRAYRHLRGSDSIYGESIYTKRAEVFGTYELPMSEYVRLDYSLSTHDQDSYYGDAAYQAQQHIAYANLVWNRQLKKHDVTAGLTNRYQFYDDNTVATGDSLGNLPNKQYLPGIFAQDEWDWGKFTILAGSRLDYYEAHGAIVAPRLNVKYKPGKWTTLRANFGTGFRVVNLFAEDHAFITGNRSVEITEELKPERSYNWAVNFNHIYTLLGGQGTLDMDVFYTYFTNKIIPDYGSPGKIVYDNTSGHAESRGVSMSINHSFAFPLAFNLGVNYLNAIQSEPDENGDNVTSKIEYSPDWSAVFSANYNWKKPGLAFAYTTNITGPMQLPEVFDLDENGVPFSTPRPTRSKTFAIQNVQITKSFKKSNWKVYVGLQNIFNHIQKYSPLTGYNDPNAYAGFSDYFDTAYAYSPMLGREVFFGVRWKLERKGRAAAN